MPVTTSERQINITNFRYTTHANCMLCGYDNGEGIQLDFTAESDGSVSTIFKCHEKYSGYDKRLHGGMISSLLDSAMTNCLASFGLTAVTAELTVRYKKPVLVNSPVKIRAWQVNKTMTIYYMQSEIIQNNEIRATGKAKFINQEQLAQ